MARKGKTRLANEVAEDQLRPIRWRRYQFIILIVCEDEKTEPQYFQGFAEEFPEETIYLRPVGTGRDALGVVQQALIERDHLLSESRKDPDEVWVVFDKDDMDLNATRRERFNDAFTLALSQNMNIAFSNEVFELWLLLHLSDVSNVKPIRRADIYIALHQAIQAHAHYPDFIYEHGNLNVLPVIREIGSEADAIIRAGALRDAHSGKHPIEANPSTSVYKIVERLRELIAYYAYQP